MLKFKKILLKPIFLFILFLAAATNASASILDYRFINNVTVQNTVIKYINQRNLKSLCDHRGITISEALIEKQKMVFSVNPSRIEEVKVDIPIVDTNNSEIFAEVRLILKFYRYEVDTNKYIDFFVHSKNKLKWSIKKNSHNYVGLGYPDKTKYVTADKLLGLKKFNLYQKLYYLYGNDELGEEIILVQEINSQKNFFYSLSTDSLEEI